VVLSDAAIREALRRGDLVIDPMPSDDLFSPTALDLRIGTDIRRFRPALYTTKGVSVAIHLDEVEIPELDPYLEPVPTQTDGTVVLPCRELIVAATLERIELPSEGRLAARVEGRSRFARLGLVVHMTAPTIHNSFRGTIALEIMNHGPIPLVVRPGYTRICQLIFERIEGRAARELDSPFQDQTGALGR
jgi:dCTP deaminase